MFKSNRYEYPSEPVGYTALAGSGKPSDTRPLIAICVPTYSRPNMLPNCLEQIAKLIRPEAYKICLIIVDNDPQAGAASSFERAKLFYPFEVHYFCEPQQGIASARNRLLQAAINFKADYIAFVDDDEVPIQNWLVQHMQALKKYGADVSHGPTIQVKKNGLPGADEQECLAKKKPTGSRRNHVSGGNVVFDAKLAKSWGLRFDPFFNQVNGEDHDFFDRAKAQGAKWIWVREAVVYESLTPERKKLRYLFSRHYSGGIDNVLKYAHSHSSHRTWLHFLPRIIGKTLSLIRSILFLDARKLIKDLATLNGYVTALARPKGLKA